MPRCVSAGARRPCAAPSSPSGAHESCPAAGHRIGPPGIAFAPHCRVRRFQLFGHQSPRSFARLPASYAAQPHSGFSEGQLVLHLSSGLSSNVSVFSELSFTARSDASLGTPPASGFNPKWSASSSATTGMITSKSPLAAFAPHQVLEHGLSSRDLAPDDHRPRRRGARRRTESELRRRPRQWPRAGTQTRGDLGDINSNRARLVNAFISPTGSTACKSADPCIATI